MQIDGWKYYNHAAIPTTAPHEEPDMIPINDGSIWKIGGGIPLLARWTTEFDCGYQTNWWYVVKDDSFDISKIKSNYRYKINKGTRFFDVHIIKPMDYKEELYNVQLAAFSAYPKKYRPTVDKDKFMATIDRWDSYVVFGAFYRETNKLVGYSYLIQNDFYVDLTVLKSNPEYEKFQINAALVYEILRYFDPLLKNGGYICDGARSINHETSFQDYLEKYFGFRKAYCKLHITYNPKFKWVIRLMYPIRRFLLKMDGIGVLHSINAVIRMEEIVRKDNERIGFYNHALV